MLRAKKRNQTAHIAKELNHGVNHFRSAAAMAAEQAAERLAPAMESARDKAQQKLGPQMVKARHAALEAWEAKGRPAMSGTAGSAREMSRRAATRARMPRKARPEPPKRHWARWMAGAIGVGAAVGAVSALISKRRAGQWHEEQMAHAVGAPDNQSAPATGGETSETPTGEAEVAASNSTGHQRATHTSDPKHRTDEQTATDAAKDTASTGRKETT